MSTQECLAEIKELIEETTEPHLADTLDLFTVPHIQAMHSFVTDQRKRKQPKAMYRFHLLQDVIALNEGKEPTHSTPFLPKY